MTDEEQSKKSLVAMVGESLQNDPEVGLVIRKPCTGNLSEGIHGRGGYYKIRLNYFVAPKKDFSNLRN